MPNPLDNRPKPANWAFWQHIQEFEIWEGVALSLDLQPGKEYGRYGWMDEAFKELPEFQERLEKASRCVQYLSSKSERVVPGKIGTRTPVDHKPQAEVAARDFAIWASYVNWPVPPDFEKFKSVGVETPDPKEAQIASLRVQLAAKSNQSAESKKLRTAQKILLGLAIKQGYKPGQSNQTATGGKAGSLATDVQDAFASTVGLTQVSAPSDDTIRDHLAKAFEALRK